MEEIGIMIVVPNLKQLTNAKKYLKLATITMNGALKESELRTSKALEELIGMFQIPRSIHLQTYHKLMSILSPIPNRSSPTSARTGELPAQTPVVAICANTKAAKEISRDIEKSPDSYGMLSDDAIRKRKVQPDLDNTMSTIVGLASAKEALM
ncbi:unnamed protein product [Orchesella dallaii]|uniref:Uncharacterized protein n=1 Tax=Orchesella dallaii TaxID=48710 RepID=A0ABP1RNR2_9HEXA